MSAERRPYHREPQERRREALILAALDLMATGGPKAATVRAIAERAGTTAGLIRHYFHSKDELTRSAYAWVTDRMTLESLTATRDSGDDPAAQLVAFVVASMRPPIMDGERVRLWAGFMHQVRQDDAMRDVHEATFLGYRARLQALIMALPGYGDPVRARELAIACNAMIDGLWMGGGTLPDSFAPGEVERIGLAAVSAILGTPLPAPLPADSARTQ